MEDAIYNSVVSATRSLEKQAIISNNLANISTSGFKEQYYYIVNNLNLKNKFNTIKKYYNFSPGSLLYTQQNLDLIIKEDGWFVVKDKKNQEAYTKNGHLQINSKGQLTIQNYEVVGNKCNINIPNNAYLEILSDGSIIKLEKNKKNNIKNKIGALKLVRLTTKDLIKKENGFFYINKNITLNKNNSIISHSNNVQIKSGMLEESNVDLSRNMIEMISNARQFEMQMKNISTCDQNLEYANQLLNINN